MPGDKSYTHPLRDGDRSLADWMRDNDEDFVGMAERLAELIPQLSHVDQELLDFHARHVNQGEIAKLYRCSQPAISYRLKRIAKRLAWLAKRPERPVSFLVDLRKALEAETRGLRPLYGVAAVAHLADNTCQSETSRLLGVSQTRIRDWARSALKRLEKLGLTESHAYLQYTMAGGQLMLHSVALPKSPRSVVNPPPAHGLSRK